MQLSNLQGSDKQIKWANDIRNEAICEAEKELAKLAQTQSANWVAEIREAYLQIMCSPEKLQASWWIDHRRNRPAQVGKFQPKGGDWEQVIMKELHTKLDQKKYVREGRMQTSMQQVQSSPDFGGILQGRTLVASADLQPGEYIIARSSFELESDYPLALRDAIRQFGIAKLYDVILNDEGDLTRVIGVH